MTNIKIPDVSFWQDDPTTPKGIDFEKMATQTKGVMIRAGQNIWQDNEFDISWHNAKQAGLLRGSYWFYDSRANPKRQAEKYVEVLGNDIGEMELWCDFEDRYGGQFGGQENWFDFMERIKSLLPHVKLGVYTGYYYWLEHIMLEKNKYFSQYPLWIAWYNPPPPRVPTAWKDWLYWQYTDNGDGSIYGVESGNIDLNYFNGSEADFLKRYGGGNPPVENKGKIEMRFGNTLVEYKEK